MERLVEHYLLNPVGEPLEGKVVIFELLDLGHQDNNFYPPSRVAVVSDSEGLVQAQLWVNSESESEVCYRVHLPGCKEFKFVIPPGDTPITLGALKEAGISWQDPRFLATIDYLQENSEELGLEVTTEKSFTHIQDAISNEWIINHGLDKYPSVVAIDADGFVQEGVVEYLDRDNLKITFIPAISGVAHLN